MKNCKNCNLFFKFSNFYSYKKKGNIYFESVCKKCKLIKTNADRNKRNAKAIQDGYTSIHDKRLKTSSEYKEYYKKKVLPDTIIRCDKRRKKAIELCSDYYIRLLIRKDKSMKGLQIPKDLIELYRSNLLLKRELCKKD